MIFILDETDLLHVADAEAEPQGAFEGIDVENGIYRFFNESGSPLVPEFTVKNKRGTSFFGLSKWIWSGTYRLIACEDDSVPHLSEMLTKDTGLEPNKYFGDIDAVRRALKKVRDAAL